MCASETAKRHCTIPSLETGRPENENKGRKRIRGIDATMGRREEHGCSKRVQIRKQSNVPEPGRKTNGKLETPKANHEFRIEINAVGADRVARTGERTA